MGSGNRSGVLLSYQSEVRASIKAGDSLATVVVPANNYRELTLDIVAKLLGSKLGGIYVTTSRPSTHVVKEMKARKASLNDLYFVDMISLTVGGETGDPRTVFIDSPTMLESVLLNIGLLERGIKAKRHFVMFDSVNGLSIYSEMRVLKEFMNVLANTMRLRRTYTTMLTVDEQTPPELEAVLVTLSDCMIRGGTGDG